ncbi:MAG: UDP-N-acetylmuramate dehydrogenase [Clostridia bacterium]|nr:UDP-N-acetylmuramate dehydrogenase [Clostridia bacterium]
MKLRDINGIKFNEPMSKHTTFRAGGAADMLYEPSTNEELMLALDLAKKENIPITVIGNGSNLLVRDGGIRGLVIKLYKNFSGILVDGDVIIARSGALLPEIGSAALAYGLSGFEFASGIPGTIGGGLVMNAGAYGGELKDIVVSCEYLENGEIKTYKNEDMCLSYRHSIFAEKNGIILSVTMRLSKGDKSEIKDKMDDLKQRRIDKQPLEFASAGSTFKRPEGYFAGKLIEDAGLKGASVGDAEISKKHAGFLINKGNATATEILELIEYVKKKVLETSGIRLETEVKIIGED